MRRRARAPPSRGPPPRPPPVEVDGAVAGTTPPLSRLTLPVGTHTVVIRNQDFPPYRTTVTVGEDRAATVRHRFGS
jgi:hypothetical protein